MINNAKPRTNFMKKIQPTGRPFDLNTIRTVGYELLNTLKLLHSKNLGNYPNARTNQIKTASKDGFVS